MKQTEGFPQQNARRGGGDGTGEDEALQRGQFTFYASFYHALESMPKCRQLEVYQGIARYALYGVMPSFTGSSESVFNAIRPILDVGRMKAGARLKKMQAERALSCNSTEGDELPAPADTLEQATASELP